MSDIDIQKLQDKVDEAIRRTQEKLVEKVKRENGQLVVTRDGQVLTLKANEI
jgi:chromosome condensin MukBEF MukE localization factor